MKKCHHLLIAVFAVLLLFSCKKDSTLTAGPAPVSPDVLAVIKSLGFSTEKAVKMGDDYLVEGDIILTRAYLAAHPSGRPLTAPGTEQYRTADIITGLPRTILVQVQGGLDAVFVEATDIAIARYNALHLQLAFTRITTGTPDIVISGINQPATNGTIMLGNSGFPANGKPYSSIILNTNRLAFGLKADAVYVGSVIQHEIGHCIGFRHTDFKDRGFSCGGYSASESSSDAILIGGTPADPDPGSWMLACANGVDRSFNFNDLTALNFLYGVQNIPASAPTEQQAVIDQNWTD